MKSWAALIFNGLALLIGSWAASASPPHLVKDVNDVAQGVSSYPSGFFIEGGKSLFYASGGTHGGVWGTDGTAGGTSL
ncbi:MAG TPA: hypothetical protein VKT54_13190, partial [Steroidobacteraceae bacterium]|nr:hypothetical protein [Steroidobacteraceae bacterium]